MTTRLTALTDAMQEPHDELRITLRTLHSICQQQATQGGRRTNKRQLRQRVRAETLLLIAGWLQQVEATSPTPRDLAINLTDCLHCLERNRQDEAADAKPRRVHPCSLAQQRRWQSAQVRADTYGEIARQLMHLLHVAYPNETFPATLSAGSQRDEERVASSFHGILQSSLED